MRYRIPLVFLLLVLPFVAHIAAAQVEPPADETRSDSAGAYVPSLQLKRGWYVRIETTLGRIVAQLLPEQAPQSVAHFVGLARGTLAWTDLVTGETRQIPYYDDMPIHRVIAGRLFETGDAAARGEATPTVYVPTEGMAPVNFSRPYVMGMMSLGGGRTSGAMFFVTASAQHWLNGSAPCFGAVVEGNEVVFNISQAKASKAGRPLEPILIETMEIFSVDNPDPLPEPEVFTPKLIDIEFSGSDSRAN